MLFKLRNKLATIAAIAAVALTMPRAALADVPTPPTPSTSPSDNDAIGWIEGVIEDASEVAILALGIGLFALGAAGMIWAIVQIMNQKGTILTVAMIGLASAAGIMFGTWALGMATGIIT